ncbi:MAG: ATP-dependent DNA helicase RecG [Alphaproteobacteria bacterium]|nr:ATP-dependent DNA helicase RecG [Alphaproteobacteria bacterium]
MRPEILYPLFKTLRTLPGIGPRNAKLVERVAGGRHVVDLLWHLPTGLIDRSFQPLVRDAPAGRIATLLVTVDKHVPAPNRRLPYKVLCSDHSGTAELVFFHARPDWLEKTLPMGAQRVVSGKVEHYRGAVQITHPDHIGLPEDRHSLAGIEPVYGLTQGLSPKTLGRAIGAALAAVPELPQWLDEAHLGREGWAPWKDALLTAHTPESESDLDSLTASRRRLAYDEMLASQLAMSLVRLHMRRQGGIATLSDGALRARAVKSLPFTLTGCQQTALGEILGDMGAELRMLRLLQGDVGSGKTVVAALAMLEAIGAGRQAAMMAPTEILARQHLAAMAPVFEAVGAKLALLTGRHKGAPRRRLLEDLASGELDALVGTHALISEDVVFADLALAVVDEQQRFGVAQRLQLAGKGRGTDVLVMTATPIPRTLTLMAYGDLDISRLTEKPAGRPPVDTRTVPLARLDEVISGIGRAIGGGAQGGRQVFWVCPLVEESEAIDLAAAEERSGALARLFPGLVGLVHGRMKGPEKDAAMSGFAEGRIRILVATTVIEVGVDIPEATVMVVEHAERFGLAQLHQLRGRIGRGSEKSTCLLLYGQALTATARERLKILRRTEDGFAIAEEDLRLRGAGEILGTRQSGLPAFRVADIAAHGDLMQTARDDAALILDKDPGLATARGAALRVLLYLFERDAAVGYARSG